MERTLLGIRDERTDALENLAYPLGVFGAKRPILAPLERFRVNDPGAVEQTKEPFGSPRPLKPAFGH